MTSGYDFGSHYDAIQAPRVATIVGPGVSSLSAGEIWHHFETKLDYPLNRVGALEDLDLDNLDVVVLPSGWYRMDDDERSDLAAWVRGGGQLVAVGGACSAFVNQDGWGLQRYAEGERAAIEAAEEAVQEAADERNAHDRAAQGLDPLPFTDQDRDGLRYDLPGAIFRAAVDESHPLADGYGSEYMTLRTSGRRYAALDEGNVAVLPPGDQGRPFSGHAGGDDHSRPDGIARRRRPFHGPGQRRLPRRQPALPGLLEVRPPLLRQRRLPRPIDVSQLQT